MLESLAKHQSMLSLLEQLYPFGVQHLFHWKQGEFHHDYVLKVDIRPQEWTGDILVVSTNCNAGVKEILCLAEVPDRWALWHFRCPKNQEFEGQMPPILGTVRTGHYFDPCELLEPDARSEYKSEFRRRQRGGGWLLLDSDGN